MALTYHDRLPYMLQNMIGFCYITIELGTLKFKVHCENVHTLLIFDYKHTYISSTHTDMFGSCKGHMFSAHCKAAPV